MINFFDISKKPHKEESTRIHELKNFKKPKKLYKIYKRNSKTVNVKTKMIVNGKKLTRTSRSLETSTRKKQEMEA